MKKISLFLISIFILYGCGNNSPTTSEESPLLPNIKKYKLDEENSLSSNNQQYKLDAEGSLSPKPGKYNFVIYKDSTGDFFAPNGGRICSIESIKTDKYELLNHKKEWLQIYLSREMKFLDSYSCFIYLLYDEQKEKLSYRLFTDLSDLLHYGDNTDLEKKLGVPVEYEEDEEKIVYYFNLDNRQIEQMDIEPIKITFGDEYTLIAYEDNKGVLYDVGGKRICNLHIYHDDEPYIHFRANYEISLFNNGKKYNDFYIYNSGVYTDFMNILKLEHNSDRKYDKRLAEVRQLKKKNAVIYKFSKTAISPKPIKN